MFHFEDFDGVFVAVATFEGIAAIAVFSVVPEHVRFFVGRIVLRSALPERFRRAWATPGLLSLVVVVSLSTADSRTLDAPVAPHFLTLA